MAEVLRMPEVAANTTEAILDSWNVAVGTEYAAGDALVTVETEKAVVDFEAESAGVLLRLLVEAGTSVAVGTPIAVWAPEPEADAAVDALVASLNGRTADPGTETPSPPDVVMPAPVERIFTSPLARRLARDLDVDLTKVVGSGPGGRIRRQDVERAAADRRPAAAPAAEPAMAAAEPAVSAVEPRVPAAEPAGAELPAPVAPPLLSETPVAYVDVPNSRMRAAIARRLTESKQNVPHFYLRAGARVDAMLELRQQLNAEAGTKISVNDLLVKAIAGAHRAVPAMNVQWNDRAIRHYRTVDVAIAVATEGGLVTPVVRGVDGLSLGRVAEAAKDLVARARERKLRQEELEGGTIAVTNLGMYGTEDFAAIINPPQAAILAVGAIRDEPVVADGSIRVASVLRMTLAVDHRPVDGATAAAWLKAYVALLEHPVRILL